MTVAKDSAGYKIQAFVPDPTLSQVNTAMTGTVVFKRGSGATVDVTNWLAIRIVASAASTYYFNADTTKRYPLAVGVENVIYVTDPNFSQVSFVLGAGIASIQGMSIA